MGQPIEESRDYTAFKVGEEIRLNYRGSNSNRPRGEQPLRSGRGSRKTTLGCEISHIPRGKPRGLGLG